MTLHKHIEPQTIFIKNGISSYFLKLCLQRQFVKIPMYAVAADSRFPFASRTNPRHDRYHFSDTKEKAICIESNIDKSLLFSGGVEDFLKELSTKPKGLILAEDENCNAALALSGEHDVLLIMSDLTDLQSKFDSHSLDIHHYYTFIDYEKGSVRHLFCSMNINKHDTLLFPFNSSERARILRKVATHQKAFSTMGSEEAHIVCAGVIGATLKKL